LQPKAFLADIAPVHADLIGTGLARARQSHFEIPLYSRGGYLAEIFGLDPDGGDVQGFELVHDHFSDHLFDARRRAGRKLGIAQLRDLKPTLKSALQEVQIQIDLQTVQM
jgi:hypothetical protein